MPTNGRHRPGAPDRVAAMVRGLGAAFVVCSNSGRRSGHGRGLWPAAQEGQTSSLHDLGQLAGYGTNEAASHYHQAIIAQRLLQRQNAEQRRPSSSSRRWHDLFVHCRLTVSMPTFADRGKYCNKGQALRQPKQTVSAAPFSAKARQWHKQFLHCRLTVSIPIFADKGKTLPR